MRQLALLIASLFTLPSCVSWGYRTGQKYAKMYFEDGKTGLSLPLLARFGYGFTDGFRDYQKQKEIEKQIKSNLDELKHIQTEIDMLNELQKKYEK